MADISKIKFRGTTYNIKDIKARNFIDNVIGVLSWINKYGSYVLTTDTEVNAEQIYFERESENNYVPVIITDNTVDPSEMNWYILDITDSLSDYIISHFKMTSEGLWILLDGDEQNSIGYKILLAEDNISIFNDTGNIIAQSNQQKSYIGNTNKSHLEIDDTSIVFSNSDSQDKFSVNFNPQSISETINQISPIPFNYVLHDIPKEDSISLYCSVIEEPYEFSIDGQNLRITDQRLLNKSCSIHYLSLNKFNISVSEGYETRANGQKSHAEGHNTKANGTDSHAEGELSEANGIGSHAEGANTEANGDNSHAEGFLTQANGNYSHAEGNWTIANKIGSHVEGSYTEANGFNSHAEGGHTKANGYDSHAEGSYTEAIGDNSHAEGNHAQANGADSHAEGYYTKATGSNSHVEGEFSEANGIQSHAEGGNTKANGYNSHAEGCHTKATGLRSHAEGFYTEAIGSTSHAEGHYTEASGNYSHAEGYITQANGFSSHAAGGHTTANGEYQTVIGKNNIADTENKYAFIIGNGEIPATGENDILGPSSNALTVDWNGNITVANHDSPIGTIIQATTAASTDITDIRNDPGVSITNGQATVMLEIEIGIGVWFIEGNVAFDANTNGRRNINISTGSATMPDYVNTQTGVGVSANSDDRTILHTTWITSRSETTSIYLNAFQNSGGNLLARGWLRAVRIS